MSRFLTSHLPRRPPSRLAIRLATSPPPSLLEVLSYTLLLQELKLHTAPIIAYLSNADRLESVLDFFLFRVPIPLLSLTDSDETTGTADSPGVSYTHPQQQTTRELYLYRLPYTVSRILLCEIEGIDDEFVNHPHLWKRLLSFLWVEKEEENVLVRRNQNLACRRYFTEVFLRYLQSHCHSIIEVVLELLKENMSDDSREPTEQDDYSWWRLFGRHCWWVQFHLILLSCLRVYLEENEAGVLLLSERAIKEERRERVFGNIDKRRVKRQAEITEVHQYVDFIVQRRCLFKAVLRWWKAPTIDGVDPSRSDLRIQAIRNIMCCYCEVSSGSWNKEAVPKLATQMVEHDLEELVSQTLQKPDIAEKEIYPGYHRVSEVMWTEVIRLIVVVLQNADASLTRAVEQDKTEVQQFILKRIDKMGQILKLFGLPTLFEDIPEGGQFGEMRLALLDWLFAYGSVAWKVGRPVGETLTPVMLVKLLAMFEDFPQHNILHAKIWNVYQSMLTFCDAEWVLEDVKNSHVLEFVLGRDPDRCPFRGYVYQFARGLCQLQDRLEGDGLKFFTANEVWMKYVEDVVVKKTHARENPLGGEEARSKPEPVSHVDDEPFDEYSSSSSDSSSDDEVIVRDGSGSGSGSSSGSGSWSSSSSSDDDVYSVDKYRSDSGSDSDGFGFDSDSDSDSGDDSGGDSEESSDDSD